MSASTSLLTAAIAGCFSAPQYNGLLCDGHAVCPEGLICAADKHCRGPEGSDDGTPGPDAGGDSQGGSRAGAPAAASTPDGGSSRPGNAGGDQAVGSGPAGPVPPGTPRLEVSATLLNFGDVGPTPVTTPVVIRNAGTAPLAVSAARFVAVRPTYFDIDASAVVGKPIPPGASASLVIKFAPKVQTKTATTATILIESNDPVTPGVEFAAQGTCTACTPLDAGCDLNHPRRIYPASADTTSCTNGAGMSFPTTGPSAAYWTYYHGCATRLGFDVTAGKEVSIWTTGDGCGCPGCVNWHIDYDLLEDLGAGLTRQLHVQEPDASACPGGHNVANTTRYVPRTSVLEMQAQPDTSGEGYYFQVCTE